MKTKYDLLYALYKLSNPTLSQAAQLSGITYPSAVKMLKLLEAEGLLKKGSLTPETAKAKLAKEIIEWCYYYDCNYNFFFSEELAKFLAMGLKKGEILSKDEKMFNRTTFFYYINKLKEKHLLLIIDKKPLKAVIYPNQIIEKVLLYYGHKIIPKEIDPNQHDYDKIVHLIKNDYKREIEFLHSSLFMEGTTLTLTDAKSLFIRKIAPNKPIIDIKNMENYKTAVDYVLSSFNSNLTEETILKLQAITMKDSGKDLGIRTKEVHISGNSNFKICKTSEIKKELNDFLLYFNKKLKEKQSIKDVIATAAFIHNQFQYIHPFYDGNSRTTRLLWQYFLLNKKFPIIDIYASQKEKYMSLTKMYVKRDDSKLASFLAFVILDNLQNVVP